MNYATDRLTDICNWFAAGIYVICNHILHQRIASEVELTNCSCPSSSTFFPKMTAKSFKSRCSTLVRCCRPACCSANICVICANPSSSTTVHSAPPPPVSFPPLALLTTAPTTAQSSFNFPLSRPLLISSPISSSCALSASSSGRIADDRKAGIKRCKCWISFSKRWVIWVWVMEARERRVVFEPACWDKVFMRHFNSLNFVCSDAASLDEHWRAVVNHQNQQQRPVPDT